MADNDRHGDPVLARGLAQPRRRDVLGLGGLAAAGLALAACGGGSSPKPPPVAHAQNAVARFWAAQKQHGHVNFANWPLYIDTGRQDAAGVHRDDRDHSQLRRGHPGRQLTGSARSSPIIRAGESIGYDLMVVTNGFWFSQLLTVR